MTQKLSSRQVRERIAKSPFLETIGARLERTQPDGVTLACRFRDDLRNVFGGLHGGVAATLADAAAAFAIQRHFGGVRSMATVEMKINYFLPVREGVLRARARLLRAGNTLCVAAVELSDSQGRATGAALVTYMLLKP